MDIWHDVSAGENSPEEVNVIIEIPKGSQNKYEFDKKTGLVILDRVLYASVHYPADYGMIPQTYAPDGDPFDAIVLITNPTQPGVLIKSRPIGIMHMIDDGEQDDKLLCVPVNDVRFEHMNDLSDVPQPIIDEITNFFESYKTLEKKEVKIEGWENAATAKKILNQSIAAYKEKFAK